MTILLFLGLVGLGAVGLICLKASRTGDDLCWGSGIVLLVLAITIFLIAIIVLPLEYYNNRAKIEQYKAVVESIDLARATNPEIIERAAILQTITEWNAWLTSQRYWNNTIFDWYIPDEVEYLEFIK